MARIIAAKYAETESWTETRAWVLSTNALQCRSQASLLRLERELRQRLQLLTSNQLSFLFESHLSEAVFPIWLSACKQSPFLFDFASQVLRQKIEIFDLTLRPSDLEKFIEGQSTREKRLQSVSSATMGKIKNILLSMLREAGILQEGPELGTIAQPALNPDFVRIIVDDHPKWLACLLVLEKDISSLHPD